MTPSAKEGTGAQSGIEMRDNNMVNVVDLEATCWAKGEEHPGIPSEIIEIGITEVDMLAREVGKSRSILITPENSRVSEFCTDLTGHTQERLEADGVDYGTALSILHQEFKFHQRTMVSWGDYDRTKMLREAAEKDVSIKIVRHLNLKTMFSVLCHPVREVGMKKALRILNLKLAGRHHSGVDDSFNTARILLDLQRSIVNDL